MSLFLEQVKYAVRVLPVSACWTSMIAVHGHDAFEEETLALGTSRSSDRRLVIGAVVLLLVGLLVGFVVGHNSSDTPRAKAAPTLTVTASPSSGAVSLPAVGATPTLVSDPASGRCALQTGRTTIQLGIQVTNTAATPVQLQAVTLGLPAGGLRVRSIGVGTCAQLNPIQDPVGTSLDHLGTVSLVATVRVLTGCPAPYPVSFRVAYRFEGGSASVEFASFPDLGEVFYTGC